MGSKSPDKNVIIGLEEIFMQNYGGHDGCYYTRGKIRDSFHDPNMVQISFPYPWLFDGFGAAGKSKAEKFFFDELDKLFQENPHILKQYKCVYTRKLPRLGCNVYPKEFIMPLENTLMKTKSC